MKKRICIFVFGLFLLAVMCVFIVSMTYKPTNKDFNLDVSFSEPKYNNGQQVEISARLKNKTMGIYKAKFTGIFIIVYGEFESEPEYILISRYKILYPFSTIKSSNKFVIDTIKNYNVKVFTIMTIKGKEIILEKIYRIESGIVINNYKEN